MQVQLTRKNLFVSCSFFFVPDSDVGETFGTIFNHEKAVWLAG